MKRLMILLFVLMGTQISAQVCPKEANEIVIHTSLEYEEAFERVMNDLIRRGYSLDKADEAYGRLETLPFMVRWGFIDADVMEVSFQCQINKLKNGTEVVIRGNMSLGSSDLSYPSLPITNTGAENSATFSSWQMMKDFAAEIPSKDISYQVNPEYYTAHSRSQ